MAKTVEVPVGGLSYTTKEVVDKDGESDIEVKITLHAKDGAEACAQLAQLVGDHNLVLTSPQTQA